MHSLIMINVFLLCITNKYQVFGFSCINHIFVSSE